MTTQGKAIYSGSPRHTLDDKNRVTIPSTWRSVHPEGAQFLAIPQNGGIMILSPAKVAHIMEQVEKVPSTDDETQAALQRFFARANTFSFDKQGRMPLIEAHRNYAAINKDVVLVGAGANFVIYNPETWAKVLAAQENEQAKKDARILTSFGI